MENWKPIKEYEGIYEISSYGRVKSVSNSFSKKEKILKTFIRSGYPAVSLNNKGFQTHYSIHRLVAEHFIENPKALPQVNHIDEDKMNFSISNLEWCSGMYNTRYTLRGKQLSFDF